VAKHSGSKDQILCQILKRPTFGTVSFDIKEHPWQGLRDNANISEHGLISVTKCQYPQRYIEKRRQVLQIL
jgi:hypothetical protein